MPKQLFPRWALALTILLSPGCEQWMQNLRGVGLLIHTPARVEASGWDNNLSAVLPPEFFEQPHTQLMSGLQEIDGFSPNASTFPALGAHIKLSTAAQSFTLCEDDLFQGYYSNTVSSEENPQACTSTELEYTPNQAYTLNIEWQEVDYTIHFATPPAGTTREFSWSPPPAANTPALGVSLTHHPKGQDLTLHWESSPLLVDHLPTLSVSRLRYVGDVNAPGGALVKAHWELDPQTPLYTFPAHKPDTWTEALLRFIVIEPTTSHTLPGQTVFNETGLYMVSLTPLQISTHTSNNLTLGSAVLSGESLLYLFWVN